MSKPNFGDLSLLGEDLEVVQNAVLQHAEFLGMTEEDSDLYWYGSVAAHMFPLSFWPPGLQQKRLQLKPHHLGKLKWPKMAPSSTSTPKPCVSCCCSQQAVLM